MSGGVDSSVAAALMHRAGCEVIGITMRLSDGDWEAHNACCGLSELHDARRVADKLGIRHYVLNHAREFRRGVIDDFVREYAAGRTPNPCVRCNQHIKFATFLAHARALGCSHVVTGHYARITREAGRWTLWRGRDHAKDQSYVLWPMTQEQLGAALFPLGDLTKPEVRALAASLGLPTADKPESQDICFVNGEGHAAFVARYRPEAAEPGPIVDATGRRLGRHRGLVHYTIGQRQGLGLVASEPFYVTEIRAADNTVVVAPAAEAGRSRFTLSEVNWVSAPPAREPIDALVQIRYRAEPVPGRLDPHRGEVELAEPQRGISPGQSAVLYDRDGRVLVGGIIAAVAAPEAPR